MSVATIEHGWQQRFEAAAAELSLDDLLVGLWEELTSGRAVQCPVCGGSMRPESRAAPRQRIGRCEECGARMA